MRPPIKYVLRQEDVSNTFTKGTSSENIVTHCVNLVKRKFDRIATSFWRANYNLETARKEHADLGHLWKQVWYCIVLSVFRLISGRVR